MSWLTKLVRPKIQAFDTKKDVPEDLWCRCDRCEQMIFHRDLSENLHVCTHCQFHLRLPIQKRLALLFDQANYQRWSVPKAPIDPLKFRDSKKYVDRLKTYQQQTQEDDAIVVATGTIEGIKSIVACFNFNFMGGSMGIGVGNGLVFAAQKAYTERLPLIVITASGGARMQEGIYSLMQMPRSVAAITQLKKRSLPYVVILTDPTTGGVSASFAMLGDIAVAEPGTMIGFAGARVIQDTVRQKLPEGFQTAEYLLAHGMIDMVVPRQQLKSTLSKILNHLTPVKH